MSIWSNNNGNAIVSRLGIFCIIAFIYFYIIMFMSRLVYQESLFFLPKTTYITAIVNMCIIMLSSFAISSGTIKWFKKCNKKLLIIICICVFLIGPIFFLKAGIVADDEHISKNNMWGKTKEKYSYSDVESFDISVKYGIEYYITLNSEKTISLCSHEIPWFNFFKNEKNLHDFDNLLEKNAKKNVYKDIYSTPRNIKRFFRDDKYYNYFNEMFN